MNKRRFIILLTIFLLVILPISESLSQPADSIIVASFNIANLGDRDEYKRSLISLVNIILETKADLLAIQEVEPNELGKDQIERLVFLLNKAADYYDTESYNFEVSDEYTGDETTAFIWREPVTIQSEITLMEHIRDRDNDGIPLFQRTPSQALFSAGDLDFIFMNCHFYTRAIQHTSEGREAEFEELVRWIISLDQQSERDAIILGDFNRFLNDKDPWEELMFTNYQQAYRFPLMEAIQQENPSFNPREDEAPEDRYSTTTSAKRSIYDQIIITRSLYGRVNSPPVFGSDVGIVNFDDDDYEWFIGSWHNATALLSDHRPIWLKISIREN